MVLNQARKDILAILNKAGVAATPADLVFPPDPQMGDLSLPLFALAKERKIAPGALAQELARTLKPAGLVERLEAAGPYLNFRLKRGEVAKMMLTLPSIPSRQGRGSKTKSPSPSGRGQGRGNQRIMMEMVSPNNNKPLHLGHLRNAFLGESVARLLESQGAKIIRTCLFNDRGLAIAKAMLAYKLWGPPNFPSTKDKVKRVNQSLPEKGDHYVVQWYVLFEQRAKSKEQSDLQKQAEELVRLWEAGDKETLALWKKMAGWALDGINETLKRIEIKFNTIYYESELWKQGKKVVEQGLKKGIFKKDESGAVLVEFDSPSPQPSPIKGEGVIGNPPPLVGGVRGGGLPPKVLLRSDGTAIYATSDLALTPEKFRKYKLSHSIWCVGQEQDLYLKQLFAIFKLLNYKWSDSCEHLTYGHVALPEGRMKTREGTVVEADNLLDELHELARKETQKRHKGLGRENLHARAETIAQAAVRYHLLRVDPKSGIQFDPQQSLAFTGDTGPYLLYTYARIASILRKAETRNLKLETRKSKSPITNFQFPISQNEWTLILLLARFPEIITQATKDRDPSHLAKYLYKLAQQFSDFYENSPILKSAEPIRSFRLALISAIQKTLKHGLHLLTIETVEEM
ncbi:arginine--tRNA ligase [Candidatus Uhrbacteria bacterium]|nr:arginine--tRNA ligase [Candidatus Uhrbacteria bacterium]